MIRTVIIEDEPEIRAELASSLGKEPDLEVVGTFATAEAAMVGLAGTNPDVVLTDIRLSGANGIDLIRHFATQLRAVFLVLTTFDDDELVFGALEAGASGYLLKRSVPGDIAGAVRELHQGGSPMSGSIARKVVAVFRKPPQSSQEALSTRENQLLERIAQGRSYKECAADLTISVDTVRTHIRRIYRKLHVRSRHEAVAKLRGDVSKGKPLLRR